MSNGQQGVTIVINAQTAQAASDLQKFFTGFMGQMNGLSALSEGLNGLLGGLGVGLGVSELSSFVSKSTEATKQLAQLNAALQSSGNAGAANAEALAQQRTELSALTGTREEDLVAVQKTLLVNGASMDQLKQLVPLALDYAAATGQDAATAAMELGRAVSGQSVQMRGVRLQIDQTLPKYLQYAQLVEQLSKRVNGSAVAGFQSNSASITFQKEKEELEKNLGTAIKTDVITPFLQAMSAGLQAATEKVKNFNDNYPTLAAAFKTLATLAGELAPVLIPVAIGLTSIIAVSGTLKLAWMALTPAVAGLNAAFAAFTGIEGASLLSFLGMAVTSTSGFTIAIGTLMASVAAFLPVMVALAAGFLTIRAAVQWWDARNQEKESATNATSQLNALNDAIQKHINTLVEAKAMTAAEGGALAVTAENARTAFTEGKINAQQYSKTLDDMAANLRTVQQQLTQAQAASRNFLAEARAQAHNTDGPLASFHASDEAVILARAAAKAEQALAALDLQEARNEADYKNGVITVDQYSAAMQRLSEARADVKSQQAFTQFGMLDAQKAELESYLQQQEKSGAAAADILKTQAALDKVNIDLEAAKTKSVQDYVEAKKNELDIDEKIEAALKAQAEVQMAQSDLAVKTAQDKISDIQSNPILSASERQKQLDEATAEANQELQKQIATLQELRDELDYWGIDSSKVSEQIIADNNKVTKNTNDQEKNRTQARFEEASAAASIAGSMSQVAQMFGKKGFLAYKMLQLAQAAISGAAAVLLQLGSGDGYSAPFRAAAAAAAAAVQIAVIASTGYKVGGYTGDGSPSEVAGLAHKGEFVFSAPSVDRLGVPMLEALHSGNVSPLLPSVGGTGSASPLQPAATPQRVIIVDERKRMQDLKSDPQFHSVVVDIMKDNAWRFRA